MRFEIIVKASLYFSTKRGEGSCVKKIDKMESPPSEVEDPRFVGRGFRRVLTLIGNRSLICFYFIICVISFFYIDKKIPKFAKNK